MIRAPMNYLTIKGNPVSAKNARRIVFRPSGVPFVAPDVKVRKWMKSAIAQLQEQWGDREPLSGPLHVDAVVVIGPRQRLDLDNALGGVFDALERAGVIVNDNLVESLAARMVKTDRKNPRVDIIVEPITREE